MSRPAMTTRLIGIKELRQNMAAISEAALKKNQRLIVLKKNRPVFELRPISPAMASLEQLLGSLEEAEADVRAGRVYSPGQAKKKLGL